jgi:hypothetical protein
MQLDAHIFEANMITDITTTTYWVKIYLSGPIEVAKQILRQECKREGLCVTIEPTTYIYTGGEEQGYVVGLINYPRFPKQPSQIWERACNIAHKLRVETFQDSCCIMDSSNVRWMSDREEL